MQPKVCLRILFTILLLVPLSGGLGGCAGAIPSGQLVGVWRASFVDPNLGPAAVELILMNDGTFVQQTAYQAGALVTIFGTYRIFTNESLLRLDIQRGEPAQSCGPLGCTPIIYPAGESYIFSLPNGTTLQLQLANCNPAAGGICTFNYQRIV